MAKININFGPWTGRSYLWGISNDPEFCVWAPKARRIDEEGLRCLKLLLPIADKLRCKKPCEKCSTRPATLLYFGVYTSGKKTFLRCNAPGCKPSEKAQAFPLSFVAIAALGKDRYADVTLLAARLRKEFMGTEEPSEAELDEFFSNPENFEPEVAEPVEQFRKEFGE